MIPKLSLKIFAIFCIIYTSCEKSSNESPVGLQTQLPINNKPIINLISPIDGAIDQDTSCFLEWNSSDLDGDNLTYDLYFDSITHYSTSWPMKAHGIKSTRFLISKLKYNKKYYWKVCVTDGKDSVLSTTYDFRTKLAPITEETFTGLWQEDGYVSDTLAYHFILLLNSDMSFSFTLKRASDDYQLNTYNGYYSIASNTTIRFDYTSASFTDAYYTYRFSNTRSVLYLKPISGYDFMNSKVGTEWTYTRE